MIRFKDLTKVGLALALCFTFTFAGVGNAMGDNNDPDCRKAKERRNDICDEAEKTKDPDLKFDCKNAEKTVKRVCNENEDEDDGWHGEFEFRFNGRRIDI